MVRLAVILQRDSTGVREERLGRILTFFGVPWISRSLADLVERGDSSPWSSRIRHPRFQRHAGGGAVDARVQKPASTGRRGVRVRRRGPDTVAADSVDAHESPVEVAAAVGRPVPVRVTDALPELTGPMSGIEFEGRPAAQREAFVPSMLATDAAS